jgi:hypothetical protein
MSHDSDDGQDLTRSPLNIKLLRKPLNYLGWRVTADLGEKKICQYSGMRTREEPTTETSRMWNIPQATDNVLITGMW